MNKTNFLHTAAVIFTIGIILIFLRRLVYASRNHKWVGKILEDKKNKKEKKCVVEETTVTEEEEVTALPVEENVVLVTANDSVFVSNAETKFPVLFRTAEGETLHTMTAQGQVRFTQNPESKLWTISI